MIEHSLAVMLAVGLTDVIATLFLPRSRPTTGATIRRGQGPRGGGAPPGRTLCRARASGRLEADLGLDRDGFSLNADRNLHF